jgi:predicted aminopeptidase
MIELVRRIFDNYNRRAFNGRLTARLEIMSAADVVREGAPGRYCGDHDGERCDTMLIDPTQRNVLEILLHEMAHASLYQRGDPHWGEHYQSFEAELLRAQRYLKRASERNQQRYRTWSAARRFIA